MSELPRSFEDGPLRKAYMDQSRNSYSDGVARQQRMMDEMDRERKAVEREQLRQQEEADRLAAQRQTDINRSIKEQAAKEGTDKYLYEDETGALQSALDEEQKQKIKRDEEEARRKENEREVAKFREIDLGREYDSVKNTLLNKEGRSKLEEDLAKSQQSLQLWQQDVNEGRVKPEDAKEDLTKLQTQISSLQGEIGRDDENRKKSEEIKKQQEAQQDVRDGRPEGMPRSIPTDPEERKNFLDAYNSRIERLNSQNAQISEHIGKESQAYNDRVTQLRSSHDEWLKQGVTPEQQRKAMQVLNKELAAANKQFLKTRFDFDRQIKGIQDEEKEISILKPFVGNVIAAHNVWADKENKEAEKRYNEGRKAITSQIDSNIREFNRLSPEAAAELKKAKDLILSPLPEGATEDQKKQRAKEIQDVEKRASSLYESQIKKNEEIKNLVAETLVGKFANQDILSEIGKKGIQSSQVGNERTGYDTVWSIPRVRDASLSESIKPQFTPNDDVGYLGRVADSAFTAAYQIARTASSFASSEYDKNFGEGYVESKELKQIQKNLNLSDKQMSAIISDIVAENKPWDPAEKTRTLSHGAILFNPDAAIYDADVYTDAVNTSSAPQHIKDNYLSESNMNTMRFAAAQTARVDFDTSAKNIPGVPEYSNWYMDTFGSRKEEDRPNLLEGLAEYNRLYGEQTYGFMQKAGASASRLNRMAQIGNVKLWQFAAGLGNIFEVPGSLRAATSLQKEYSKLDTEAKAIGGEIPYVSPWLDVAFKEGPSLLPAVLTGGAASAGIGLAQTGVRKLLAREVVKGSLRSAGAMSKALQSTGFVAGSAIGSGIQSAGLSWQGFYDNAVSQEELRLKRKLTDDEKMAIAQSDKVRNKAIAQGFLSASLTAAFGAQAESMIFKGVMGGALGKSLGKFTINDALRAITGSTGKKITLKEFRQRLIAGGYSVVKPAVVESAEEGVDEFIAAVTLDPTASLEEALYRGWEGAKAGLVLGGAFAAVASATNTGIKSVNAADPDTALAALKEVFGAQATKNITKGDVEEALQLINYQPNKGGQEEEVALRNLMTAVDANGRIKAGLNSANAELRVATEAADDQAIEKASAKITELNQARAIINIANGKSVQDLTIAEQKAIKGNLPTGVPVSYEVDGNVVLSDDAIALLARVAPDAARDLVSLSETGRKEQIKQKAAEAAAAPATAATGTTATAAPATTTTAAATTAAPAATTATTTTTAAPTGGKKGKYLVTIRSATGTTTTIEFEANSKAEANRIAATVVKPGEMVVSGQTQMVTAPEPQFQSAPADAGSAATPAGAATAATTAPAGAATAATTGAPATGTPATGAAPAATGATAATTGAAPAATTPAQKTTYEELSDEAFGSAFTSVEESDGTDMPDGANYQVDENNRLKIRAGLSKQKATEAVVDALTQVASQKALSAEEAQTLYNSLPPLLRNIVTKRASLETGTAVDDATAARYLLKNLVKDKVLAASVKKALNQGDKKFLGQVTKFLRNFIEAVRSLISTASPVAKKKLEFYEQAALALLYETTTNEALTKLGIALPETRLRSIDDVTLPDNVRVTAGGMYEVLMPANPQQSTTEQKGNERTAARQKELYEGKWVSVRTRQEALALNATKFEKEFDRKMEIALTAASISNDTDRDKEQRLDKEKIKATIVLIKRLIASISGKAGISKEWLYSMILPNFVGGEANLILQAIGEGTKGASAAYLVKLRQLNSMPDTYYNDGNLYAGVRRAIVANKLVSEITKDIAEGDPTAISSANDIQLSIMEAVGSATTKTFAKEIRNLLDAKSKVIEEIKVLGLEAYLDPSVKATGKHKKQINAYRLKLAKYDQLIEQAAQDASQSYKIDAKGAKATIRGAEIIDRNTLKSIVSLTSRADVTTVLHEFVHVLQEIKDPRTGLSLLETTIGEDLNRKMNSWLDKTFPGKGYRAKLEGLAEAIEKYLAEGGYDEQIDEDIKRSFAIIAGSAREILAAQKEAPGQKYNKNIQQIMDTLFSADAILDNADQARIAKFNEILKRAYDNMQVVGDNGEILIMPTVNFGKQVGFSNPKAAQQLANKLQKNYADKVFVHQHEGKYYAATNNPRLNATGEKTVATQLQGEYIAQRQDETKPATETASRSQQQAATARQYGISPALAKWFRPPTNEAQQGGVQAPGENEVAYSEALMAAKAAHKMGAAVDPVSPEDMIGKEMYMLADGLGGVAIGEGGYLTAVFKNPDSKEDLKALLESMGRNHPTMKILDCYDINGFLPTYYHKTMGFMPVAKVPFNPDFAAPDWNTELLGTPDVVIMVRMAGEEFNSYDDVRESVPLFTNWDEAVAHRDAIVAENIGDQNYPVDIEQSINEAAADEQSADTVQLQRGAEQQSPDIVSAKDLAELSQEGELSRGERRGMGRNRGWLPPSDSPYIPTTDPQLEGLPQTVEVDKKMVTFGPYEVARKAAENYMRKAGIKYNPPKKYAKVNKERAKRIADAYEQMTHAPQDPEVMRSYRAMINETLAQYEAIKETGLKIEPMQNGVDPYGNPRNAILDVVQNNHLWFFPTNDGFGSSDFDPTDNPLLEETGEIINGHVMLVNDVFRVVHDYFGHIKEGVGFRADGEENAWRSHSSMYTPLAMKAMTSETRGQNSWVNFGPYAKQNRTAGGADTQYADQKIGLLPDWVVSDGAGDEEIYVQLQSDGKPINDPKVVKDHINKKYGKIFKKVGVSYMVRNFGYDAYLKVTAQEGAQLFFNAEALAEDTMAQLEAAMKEELIHAASWSVITKGITGNREKYDAYTAYHRDLYRAMQESKLVKPTTQIYKSSDGDIYSYASEFKRIAIQKMLYGKTTEQEMRLTAYQKIEELLKGIVDYFKGLIETMKGTPEERVFSDTIKLVQKVDKDAAREIKIGNDYYPQAQLQSDPDYAENDRPADIVIASGGSWKAIAQILGENLYGNKPSHTVSKEIFQNAVDAVMRNRDNVERPTITYGFADRRENDSNTIFMLSDNGTGMTPREVLSKYLPPFISGKAVGEGGGYGLAKMVFLTGPNRVAMKTVAEIDGKKILTEVTIEKGGYVNWIENLDRNPPQINVTPGAGVQNPVDNFYINIIEVPAGMQTGTVYSAHYPFDESAGIYEQRWDKFLGERFLELASKYTPDIDVLQSEYRDIATGVNERLVAPGGAIDSTNLIETLPLAKNQSKTPQLVDLAGFRSNDASKTYYSKQAGDFGLVQSFETDNFSLEIIAPNGASMISPSWGGKIYLTVLNRTIMQFNTQIQGDDAALYPEGLAVNIRSKVKAGEPGYPFTMNREGVSSEVADIVSKYMNDVGREAHKKLMDKWKDQKDAALNIAGTNGKILDVGATATPEVMAEIANNTVIAKVYEHYSIIQNAILKMLDRRFKNVPNQQSYNRTPMKYGRARFAGFMFGAGAYGVHFGKPNTTEESEIWHDPFMTYTYAGNEMDAIAGSESEEGLRLAEMTEDEAYMEAYSIFLRKAAGVAFHESLHQQINDEGIPLARELTFMAGDMVEAMISAGNIEFDLDFAKAAATELIYYNDKFNKDINKEAAKKFFSSQGAAGYMDAVTDVQLQPGEKQAIASQEATNQDARVDKIIDVLLDNMKNGNNVVVPTSPLEGGKIRTIAIMYQEMLSKAERIVWNNHWRGQKKEFPKGQEKKFLKDVERASNRILEQLRIAYALFPKFQSWYESRLKMAMSIFEEMDADAAKPENNFIIRALLAITSNGNEVFDQTQDTWKIYKEWKKVGKVSNDQKARGTRQAAIKNHLILLDSMLAKIGYAELDKFLQKSGTVADMRKDLVSVFGYSEKQVKKITDGELIDEVAPYSLVFGAKLGSFFNNLSGNFETTTMDRWFMRTFGRALGAQLRYISKVDVAAKKMRLYNAMVGAMQEADGKVILNSLGMKPKKNMNYDEIKKLHKFFEKAKNRANLVEGTQTDTMRLAINGLFKIADGYDLVEAPAGSGHRRFIRLAMDRVSDTFRGETGKDWNPAEIQAILWYYEKYVHDKHGSIQGDEAPDYGSAANRLYIEEGFGEGGSSRFTESDAVSGRNITPEGLSEYQLSRKQRKAAKGTAQNVTGSQQLEEDVNVQLQGSNSDATKKMKSLGLLESKKSPKLTPEQENMDLSDLRDVFYANARPSRGKFVKLTDSNSDNLSNWYTFLYTNASDKTFGLHYDTDEDQWMITPLGKDGQPDRELEVVNPMTGKPFPGMRRNYFFAEDAENAQDIGYLVLELESYNQEEDITVQLQGSYEQNYAPRTEQEKVAFDRAKSNKFLARSPQLAVAAVRMANGQITAGDYADLVDAIDPFIVKGAEPIPTKAQILKWKKDERVYAPIPNGKLVEYRIDIKTYNSSVKAGEPVYAITAHEPVKDDARSVGEPISYIGVARVMNPKMITRSISGKGAAIDIASGAGKFPLATVKGNNAPIKELPADINDPKVWTEVSYNPVRSSYFVDVRSKQAVTGGSEAIMLGSRVFVRNPILQPRPRGYVGPDVQFQGAPSNKQEGAARAAARIKGTAGKIAGMWKNRSARNPEGDKVIKGSPARANISDDQQTRDAYDVSKEIYDDNFIQQNWNGWENDANSILANTPVDDIELEIFKAAEGYGNAGTPGFQIAAKRVVANRLQEAMATGDQAKIDYALSLAQAEQEMRGEIARSMSAMRDPFQTPAQRASYALGSAIMTAPNGQVNALKKKHGSKDGEPIPKGNRKAYNEDLKKLQKNRIDQAEKVLKRQGINLRDIFNATKQGVAIGTKIDADVLATMTDKQKHVIKMMREGADAKAIKIATGVEEDAQKKTMSMFRKALKEKVIKLVELGYSVETMDSYAKGEAPPEGAKKPKTGAEAEAAAEEIVNDSFSTKPRAGFDINNPSHVMVAARALNDIDLDYITRGVGTWYANVFSLKTIAINLLSAPFAGYRMIAERAANSVINSIANNPEAKSFKEFAYIKDGLKQYYKMAIWQAYVAFDTEHAYFNTFAKGEGDPISNVTGQTNEEVRGYQMGHFADYIDLGLEKMGVKLRRPSVIRRHFGEKGAQANISVGKTARGVLRFNMGVDEFMRFIVAGGEIGAIAYRLGTAKGLKGEELKKFITQEMTIQGSSSWVAASEEADMSVFTADLPSPRKGTINNFSDALAAIMNGLDGVLKNWDKSLAAEKVVYKTTSEGMQRLGNLARLDAARIGIGMTRVTLIPFTRVLMNLMREGFKRVPNPVTLVWSAAKVSHYAAFNRGKSNPEAAKAIDTLSRQIIAWSVASAIADMMEGDDDDRTKKILITGSMAKFGAGAQEARDAAMREGMGPYRIRVGTGKDATTFDYGRIDPLAITLGTTVDWVRAIKKTMRGEQTVSESATSLIADTLIGQMTDKTMLRGMNDTFMMMSGKTSFSKYAARQLATFLVPNVLRQPIRDANPTYDASIMDAGSEGFAKALLYEMYPNAEDKLGGALPKNPYTPPAARNAYGEPEMRPQSDVPLAAWILRPMPYTPNRYDEMVRRERRLNPEKEIKMPGELATSYVYEDPLTGNKERLKLTQKQYDILQNIYRSVWRQEAISVTNAEDLAKAKRDASSLAWDIAKANPGFMMEARKTSKDKKK